MYFIWMKFQNANDKNIDRCMKVIYFHVLMCSGRTNFAFALYMSVESFLDHGSIKAQTQ